MRPLRILGMQPKEESWVAKNNTSPGSIIFLNPNEYFQGAISGAVSSLGLRVSDHAQSYLVQLLRHFINMDNFYPTDSAGNPADTLTQQLVNALGEESTEMRAARMRQLGDFSLYIAGFFSDSLSRKLVDVDYYVGMGEAAYENVARVEKKSRAELFFELSRKFPDFVEVLSRISEESGFNPARHQDLLRVYELWSKTGNERLAKQLAKAGIVAQKPKKNSDGGDS